jgi:hypothetical protein
VYIMCVYIHTYIHTYMYTCMFLYVSERESVCLCECVCM